MSNEENTASDTSSETKLRIEALLARLRLEQLAYRYLHAAEPFLSPEDTVGWQPKKVLEFLVSEIDGRLLENRTLSVCPETPQTSTPTAADYEALDFAEIGTTPSVNLRKLNKLWQKLGQLLHADPSGAPFNIAVAKNSISETNDYCDQNSGFVFVTSDARKVEVKCSNGHTHTRNVARLKPGQIIKCTKNGCLNSFLVRDLPDSSVGLQEITLDLTCDECGCKHTFPPHEFTRMSYWQSARFLCRDCGHEHELRWVLSKRKKQATDPGNSAASGSGSGASVSAGPWPRSGGYVRGSR